MIRLEVPRKIPVRLPHPLFFQHTTRDGRQLTFRCPLPYRLTVLNSFWIEHDFQSQASCPSCPSDALSADCSICQGTGTYKRMSEARSVENTEKVACALVGSFWADGQYVLESEFNGDMDLFALEVSYELLSGDHQINWQDLSEIFKTCTELMLKQLYPASKADKEVKQLADFLSPQRATGPSSESTSASTILEATPLPSLDSITTDRSTCSPTTASGSGETPSGRN